MKKMIQKTFLTFVLLVNSVLASNPFEIEDTAKTIIRKLDPQNILLVLSLTSKALHEWCMDDDVWREVVKKEKFMILSDDSSRGIFDQFKYYSGLFLNQTQQYTITLSQLISFKNEPYQDPEHEVAYRFSINGRNFKLFNKQIDPDKLELLNKDFPITFSWRDPNLRDFITNPKQLGCFYSHVNVPKCLVPLSNTTSGFVENLFTIRRDF